MKKLFALIMGILLLIACTNQSTVDKPTTDKWNGYSKFLKTGEMVHTLWAGRNINVGIATYGLDENANFYVTYDCSASGWTISETHMFAGDKKYLPLNKPGNPKIGQFPNSGMHNPRVSHFTYRVPLASLPPCAEPGFVVASHCIVRSPSGRTETAWAEGDFKFTDKDWGWYDIYFYNQPPNEYTIIYGLTFNDNTLKVYSLNMTLGTSNPILVETLSNPGPYDGAAFDVPSSTFFFANTNTKELFVNNMADEYPSFSAGTLDGTASSGTFYNGCYYYVNAGPNTINKVIFNSDWTIASETVLDTIPSAIVVNDIAMSPAGDYLYMVGTVNNGNTELMSWQVATGTFYSMAISVNADAQIAYGSDGVLYAVAPITEGGTGTEAYTLDPSSGTLTEIDDGGIIIIIDPFADISTGPIM
jgi:hypothetical protein